MKGEAIGHRGSREEGLPENSTAAFKDAAGAGADIIELDVWLSSDGKVVVHHDETFTRMSAGSCNQRVTEMDHADMPKLVPSALQQNRMQIYDDGDCTSVPLLEDILIAVPSPVCISIEFKQNSDMLIDRVSQILTKYNRKGDVFWFSLDEEISKKLRAADSSIPTINSVPNMLKTLMLYYTGLLPFVEIDDAVFAVTVEEIPLDQIRDEQSLSSFPDWVKQVLAFLFRGRPPAAMVVPKLFTHLRARGIPVWFLGVNSEPDLLLAVQTGATGVLTDRIHWLKNTMQEKNLEFMKVC